MVFAALPAFAQKPSFPMPAAEFQQRVDARLAKGRARLEQRIKKNNLSDEQANQARARFDERATKIQTATAQATADGTVTAEEAKAVREAGGGRHPHKHDKS
jgi:hypothetical protein